MDPDLGCRKSCNLMGTGLGGHVELLKILWSRTGRNETLCRRMLIYGTYAGGLADLWNPCAREHVDLWKPV